MRTAWNVVSHWRCFLSYVVIHRGQASLWWHVHTLPPMTGEREP